ncbi:hypothetical protein GRJ2_001768900 [Grus japonensis]|uniref:Uncharacterized protein n=1 Tax=Grus japonensis TaxID=30415 RepID=A0ABC9X646_GRUJA
MRSEQPGTSLLAQLRALGQVDFTDCGDFIRTSVFQATTKVFLHKEDWQFAALQFYVQTFSHLISASLNLALDS